MDLEGILLKEIWERQIMHEFIYLWNLFFLMNKYNQTEAES